MSYEKETSQTVVDFKHLLEFVVEKTQKKYKILTGLTKNLPINRQYVVRLYYKNGVVAHYTSWESLLTVAIQATKGGKEINTVRTTREFLKDFPNWEDEQVVVEYLIPVKTTVQEYLDNLDNVVYGVKPVFDLAVVKRENEKLQAKKFKLWLRKYLKEVGVNYTFGMSTGVVKIIKDLSELK